jgi:plastocyanin
VSVWKMAIVAAGSALVLAACGSSTSDSGGGGGGSACTPKGGSATGTASQVVKINPDPNTSGKYEPSSVTVTKGQTVEWDWIDNGAQHSVTEENTTFDSGLCSAGAKFFVTFNTAGDFKYHCTIHAAMTGDVKVS